MKVCLDRLGPSMIGCVCVVQCVWSSGVARRCVRVCVCVWFSVCGAVE